MVVSTLCREYITNHNEDLAKREEVYRWGVWGWWESWVLLVASPGWPWLVGVHVLYQNEGGQTTQH